MRIPNPGFELGGYQRKIQVWTDTHAHLVDEQLSTDIPSIIANASKANVSRIVAVATDIDSSQQSVSAAEQFEPVFAAVGVHPNQCHQATSHDWQSISSLATHSNVVAIGETGLDRYWDFAPFELQVDWFRKHIDLSLKTNKALIVHMRECDQDIIECFSEYSGRSIRGVMHSFVGGWQLAKTFLDLGLYISFSGMVTFKKNDELRDVAARIPDDRILIETDSPYLSPHPFRSQRPNQPEMVVHTGQCLAQERGMEPRDFALLTSKNASDLFGFEFEKPNV